MLSREAENCQTYTAEVSDPPKARPPSNSRRDKSASKTIGTSKGVTNVASPSNKLPLCLWEEHSSKGIRHYLRNCKECPKDVKDRLFEAHRSKNKGSAKRTTDSSPVDTSVIFNATFGERHRARICADTCSDDNILDHHVLEDFKKAGVEHTVEYLLQPWTFFMAGKLPDGKAATLTFKKAVVVDVELHIRHGTALTLWGVRWLVTDQIVGDPLLGRPLLEALGLNTREILAAAAEKHSGFVNLTSLF